MPRSAIIGGLVTAVIAAAVALLLGPSRAGCFCAGLLLYPVVAAAAAAVATAMRPRNRNANAHADADDSVYGLEHGMLNLAVPPTTMWMNMGYWKATADFPRACRALVHEVLATAGLLDASSLTVVDLGFGCGDQTVYLVDKLSKEAAAEPEHSDDGTGRPRPRLVDFYVGLTESRTQFECARSRLSALGLLGRTGEGAGRPSVEIFCADAAQPASWSDDVAVALAAATRRPPPPPPPPDREAQRPRVWLLAVDSLYHFAPSRLPVLGYARAQLDASLAAFDLLLADGVPAAQRALLALVCRATGAPPANFLTADQYRGMLVAAGYADGDISFTDVSAHVFAPLARFLDRRNADLGLLGLGGIGRFHVAKWVFKWWATTGIVRGVIVVARR